MSIGALKRRHTLGEEINNLEIIYQLQSQIVAVSESYLNCLMSLKPQVNFFFLLSSCLNNCFKQQFSSYQTTLKSLCGGCKRVLTYSTSQEANSSPQNDSPESILFSFGWRCFRLKILESFKLLVNCCESAESWVPLCLPDGEDSQKLIVSHIAREEATSPQHTTLINAAIQAFKMNQFLENKELPSLSLCGTIGQGETARDSGIAMEDQPSSPATPPSLCSALRAVRSNSFAFYLLFGMYSFSTEPFKLMQPKQ